MTPERTRTTMEAYLEAIRCHGDFARYMAVEVTAEFMGTDRRVTGRAAVAELITFVHDIAFKTAVQLKSLVCAGGAAMLEAEFVGTHIAEFEGIPASLRHVRLPYTAAYELADDRITALRLYFPLDRLVGQISGAVVSATVAP